MQQSGHAVDAEFYNYVLLYNVVLYFSVIRKS